MKNNAIEIDMESIKPGCLEYSPKTSIEDILKILHGTKPKTSTETIKKLENFSAQVSNISNKSIETLEKLSFPMKVFACCIEFGCP